MYQKQLKVAASASQEGKKRESHLAANPEKTMEIVELLRSLAECPGGVLDRIAGQERLSLDDLLDEYKGGASAVQLRNQIWGLLISVGSLGQRACQLRGMTVEEVENR